MVVYLCLIILKHRKEVQDDEIEKNVANVWEHIDADICDVIVAVEFTYYNDKWIDEILVRIQPCFEN